MSTNRREFFKDLGLVVTGGMLSSADASPAGGAENAPAPSSAGQPPGLPAADPCMATPAMPPAHNHTATFDLVVVGGGISGTTAAISAARNGVKVALVHNRSMLGGNSSSEVRLYPEHNSVHQPWIKEGGIHDEFHVEERVRNHLHYREGLMNCHWDLVLYEWVIREPNITLFLNTHVHRALMQNNGRIRAVQAIQLGTEKTYELSAALFADASGDGILAYLAGAQFRWGREGRDEYHEPLAPEQADEKVMGNTLFFRAVDTGRPVEFKLPDWAAGFPAESDLTGRSHGHFECGYWWIEVGAPHHPIRDNDKITHEALRQLLGVWDHIKNRGDHGAANYALEFVGFWPYKRESRRILGDVVVTQQHVQDPQPQPDDVAYGCWGIDIHTQGGILTRDQIPYPSPRSNENWESRHAQVYGIPLRALYSRNVENLMAAGRPISCSYVAFASSRVLSTGCVVGQAVGAAAAVCKRHGTTPREVAGRHAKECQQILLRHDAHIPGVVNEDPADLARQATVIASSDAALIFPQATDVEAMKFPRAQIFPVSGKRIERVELHLQSKLDRDVEVRVGLRSARHAWDFRADRDLAGAAARVPAGHDGWVAFDLNVDVEPEQLYYVHASSHDGVFWRACNDPEAEPALQPPGTTAAVRPGPRTWQPLTHGRCFAMRLTPECRPYAGANVNRGTNRPDAWTNLWISDPARGLPAWLELRWESPVALNTVQCTFDTNTNRRETQPFFRYPDCVRDYALEAMVGGAWRRVAEVEGNYFRRREHRFDTVRTDRLRLNVLATNGAPSARVYEVRAYMEDSA